MDDGGEGKGRHTPDDIKGTRGGRGRREGKKQGEGVGGGDGRGLGEEGEGSKMIEEGDR